MSAESNEPRADGDRLSAPEVALASAIGEEAAAWMESLHRSIAFLLRHAAAKYRIALDPAGWADLDSLAKALRRLHPRFRALSVERIAAALPSQSTERFEIQDGRIRARYGHSAKTVNDFAPELPPETLFHGTWASAAESVIIEQGLRPMWRVYVHLTSDLGYAERVARAAGTDWVVFRVRAGEASRAGVVFRRASPSVWLAEEIAPQFIDPAFVLRGSSS